MLPRGLSRLRVPHVYIETSGCQMNVADTELILGTLAAAGYVRADEPARADVILLNTCAIREHAEARAAGRPRQLPRQNGARRGLRPRRPGCMGRPPRTTPAQAAAALDP